MSRYIDSEDLSRRIKKFYDKSESNSNKVFTKECILYLLNKESEKRGVNIVRCKDCVFYKSMGCAMQGFYMHDANENREQDFCSYGEKREDR